MDVKFGKVRSNSNFFAKPLCNINGDDFLDLNQNSQSFNQKEKDEEQASSPSRLNDYDSNLLSSSAYQSMPDEAFQMELRINVLEENLRKIINEVETLESLGYDIQIENLKERKYKIEEELTELNKKYTSLGFGSKISGQIASAVNSAKSKKNSISYIFFDVFNNVLSKISKKFGYNQKMHEALNNLDNINSSIDELIRLQSPYGEKVNRYEKLTVYLNQANLLHSRIAKNMKTLTNQK